MLNLVGHHHLRLEAEVGGYARERIVFVRPGLGEGPVGFAEILVHVALADLAGQGERVHEHAHGVGDPQVRTAVADGAHVHLLAAAECAHGQVSGGQAEAGRRDAQRQAALRDVDFQRLLERGRPSGLLALLPVGENGACALESLHPLPEEGFGRGVFLAAFRGFLVGGVVEVGIGLRGGLHAVQGGAQFGHEHVQRAAVEHQVVEVGQEVQAAAGPDQGGPEQRPFRQVERLEEVGLAGGELLVRKRLDGDFRFFVAGNQHHLTVHHVEAGEKCRMAVCHLQEGFPNLLRVQGKRQRPARGQVVDGLRRRLHAFEVEAFLLEGERNGTGFGGMGFGRPRMLPGHQGG